jgi:hypothetical protein
LIHCKKLPRENDITLRIESCFTEIKYRRRIYEMKKRMISILVSLVFLVLGVSSVAADSDNAALVIKLDEGCSWSIWGLTAEGGARYIQTKNGRWTLSCKGDMVVGLPLDSAVQIRSTATAPLGFCVTPYGVTFDWHTTFSPSGESKFICRGDLAP